MLVKPQTNPVARIKVVGVGGGGGNVVNTMVQDKSILDVEFLAVNTDAQALQSSLADQKIKIGEQITRGLGSGGNPVVGRKAAEENIDEIHEHLAGADMIFITAGMGGGTGTGAAPIVGEIAKNLGALTIAVVMKPFHFEGKPRMEKALKGIEELKNSVDTMIVIPNQRLLSIMGPQASFFEAMQRSDQVLLQAVKSIANLSSQTGFINVDFADVRSVMDNAGTALMGIGTAKGEDRALKAAQMAIESPLLEVKIDGATGVLFNVVGGKNLGINEIDEAAQVIRERISEDANFIFGAMVDPTLEDEEIQVTVIATGFSEADSQVIMGGALPRPRPLINTNTPKMDDAPIAPPTSVTRGNLFQSTTPTPAPEQPKDSELDDVPAFWRRKSDKPEDN